jgi:hypothetical protein
MKYISKIALPLLLPCFLVACGQPGQNPRGDSQIQNEVIQTDGSNITGVYAADLWPVNYNLHFKKLGMVGVHRDADLFSAHIRMKYAPKETTLTPALYTGRRCPNISDDLNKDAYIDILEARVAIGQVTIPFDADLDSQAAGSHQLNSSDINGSYKYDQTASFDRLFADLKTSDENPNDNIIKLSQDDGLTLPGRIVLIQGLSKAIDLPKTVATTDGKSPHQTIPVACGVLWKVPEMPEELIPESTLSLPGSSRR